MFAIAAQSFNHNSIISQGVISFKTEHRKDLKKEKKYNCYLVRKTTKSETMIGLKITGEMIMYTANT